MNIFELLLIAHLWILLIVGVPIVGILLIEMVVWWLKKGDDDERG